MRVFYFIVLIVYLLNHLAQCSVDNDFIDPSDMINYNRATKSMNKPNIKSDIETLQMNDRCTMFLSRFINVLLKTTGLNVSYFSNLHRYSIKNYLLYIIIV